MRRCGLFVLSFVLSLTASFSVFSGSAAAQALPAYKYEFIDKRDVQLYNTWHNSAGTRQYSSEYRSYTSDELFYLAGRAAALTNDQEIVDRITGAEWYVLSACSQGTQGRYYQVCLLFGDDDTELEYYVNETSSSKAYSIRTKGQRAPYTLTMTMTACTNYTNTCSAANQPKPENIDDTLFTATFRGIKDVPLQQNRYASYASIGTSASYHTAHYQSINKNTLVDSYQHQIIASTAPVTYPEDYDGDPIPTDINNIWRPHLTYTVNDKRISGLIRDPSGGSWHGDQWHSARVIIYADLGTTELYRYNNPADGAAFTYDFENYGEYKLVAEFLPPSPPYHYPDRQYFPLIIDPLIINGRTYSVYTEDLDCIDDVCSGVTEGNTTAIQRALRNIQQDMYGLQAIVFAPIAFISTLPAKATYCTPLQFTIADNTVNVPCAGDSLRSSHPNLMAIIATLMNGIVVLLVAFASFRLIRDVKNPENDRIEVLKL